ncbi:MAG: 30S ribosomal protein S6 [Endomicrobium sp.]|jgi:small subunit ribosomal protein S6|nr:30S ribosomal protein S6 [Endomicrobium sp.]
MNYETTFIVSPELSSDEIEVITKKALEVIKTVSNGIGVVMSVKRFEKKKLAYIINKFCEGNYVYVDFFGDELIIRELENFFKFNDSIIRFLTVKIKRKKDIKKVLSNNSTSVVENSDKVDNCNTVN